MLRTTNPQRSLWEAILPAEALGLPAELTRVDRLLDDLVFIEPFRVHFDPIIGRPSIPIETYLRLMFLKFRYQLGYELLCREVADSISWQRFCRIPWVAGYRTRPRWSNSPAGWAHRQSIS
jgi:IS5 family transposase